MLAKKILCLIALVSSGLAPAAEPASQKTGQVRNSSFSIDMPAGWRVAGEGGSNRVFDLVSTARGAGESTARLRFAYYTKDMLLGSNPRNRILGALSLVDAEAKVVELPFIQGLSGWTLLEIESADGRNGLTAYNNIGLDILWVNLSAPDREAYLRGKDTLIEVLRSYKVGKVSLD